MKQFKLICLIVLVSIAFTTQKQTGEDKVPQNSENPQDPVKTSDVSQDNSNLVVKGDQNQVGLVGHVPPKPTKPTPVVFTVFDFSAIDIGCGSEGYICAVGSGDNAVYCYDLIADKWTKIPLNDEITSVTRIDVDDDGKIYIVAECGVYYLDCHEKWIKLPGTAKDIGVGVNFDVWKIGGEKILESWGVWKLFCECNCDCTCERICLRFRKYHYNICEPIVKRRCYWFRADIYGIAIDVFPNGDAAVVKKDGSVHIVDSKNFTEVSIGNPFRDGAKDVTVSNDGILYVTAVSGRIYRYNPDSTPRWTAINTKRLGERLCSGPYSILWFTKLIGGNVSTSAINDYLP